MTNSESQHAHSPRVLVTRAAEQAGKLSDALRAAGFTPVEVPVLEIVPPDHLEKFEETILNLASYDWLIFTSTNAVQAFKKHSRILGIPLSAKPNIAAVGCSTADAIRELGLTVSLIPEKYVAEGLLEAFEQFDLVGKNILIIRAAVARDIIPDTLRARGANVSIIVAYGNRMPANAPEQLAAALNEGIDIAAFTSSSSVTNLREAATVANILWPLANVRAISIGPVTTQTLVEAGWPPAAEADPHDIPGLVAAISAAISGTIDT